MYELHETYTLTISSPLTCRRRPRMSIIRSGKAFHFNRARRSTRKQTQEMGIPGIPKTIETQTLPAEDKCDLEKKKIGASITTAFAML